MLPNICEINIADYEGLKQSVQNICTIELTVATGLEELAAQECREKLDLKPFTFQGRVIADVPSNKIKEVLKLRSVDHIHVFAHVESKFQFFPEREECFKELYKYAALPDWRKGIKIWQEVFGTESDDPFEDEKELENSFCMPKPEVDLKLMKNDSSISGNLPEDILSSILAMQKKAGEEKKAATEVKEESSEQPDNDQPFRETQRRGGGPKFRVSCHRVGSNHKFGSSEAARQFGGGINEKFGWPVDLSKFDLEVLLNIIDDFVYVTISLTKDPLFRRNLSFFGPTNLRSTIAYSMILLAKPEAGDFIVDPMCGGSSIPIEGSLTFPNCFHLGGDNVDAATRRSRNNIDHLINKKREKMPIDTIGWDSTSLPLRDQTVDAVVSDLPFGKRIGSRTDNRVLYLKTLIELARVTRMDTGRAVLLTHDKRSMTNSLRQVSELWKNISTRLINIGGLLGGIYILRRTGIFTDPNIGKRNNSSEGKKRKLST